MSRRIARWEVLGQLTEITEHPNAEEWIELRHMWDHPNGKDFIVYSHVSPFGIPFKALHVIDALKQVLELHVTPPRARGIRIERVV